MSQRAPDLAEPIAGYRVFRVEGGQLFGQYSTEPWPTDGSEMAARCAPETFPWDLAPREPHTAPAMWCTCGIHAKYAFPFGWLHPTAQWKLGVVLCTGTIVPHEDSFRAERARIVAFVDREQVGARLFGAPVLGPHELERFRRWEVPRSLRADSRNLIEWG